MKSKNIAISLLFLFSTISFPQDFTKITEGVVVNDGGDSWGCSWGDFDNDGYVDLFVGNVNTAIPVTNSLYLNSGEGTFDKLSAGVLVSFQSGSSSGSWGDFNNDNFLDIFVAHRGAGFGPAPEHALYVNDMNNIFNQISFVDSSTCPIAISSSWGDFDNDGNLDLIVATPSGNDTNLLFKNNSDGTFNKIKYGVIVNDSLETRDVSWVDFDNDRDLDLFVVNRGESNVLYRNDGVAGFVKITQDPVVNDNSRAYSASWGDFNNDGFLDLFVAVIDGDNLLYKNNGDGSFGQIKEGIIVNDGGVSFGSSWGDFDNDGDLELFVANNGKNNFLYSNNGDGTFTKIVDGDIVNDGGSSAGSSWADYDKDGDLDLFVANSNGENNFLYQNQGNNNHWLNVKCIGILSNKSAIGTRVKVKARIQGKGVWQMREISGQTGFGSQNSLNAEFGLGDATIIDSLVIVWPASGIVDIFTDVAVDQFLVATEGHGVTSVESSKLVPQGFRLFQNYPNPFNPTTTISYSIPNSNYVTLKVYDLLGRQVAVLVKDFQNAGRYEVRFNETSLSSGIYIYELQVGNVIKTKKMLLLR